MSKNNYRLSFEIYNGSSALQRVMLLEKDKTATFYGGVEIDSEYSSNSVVLDVQGTAGQLFSVTNSLSGERNVLQTVCLLKEMFYK